MSDVPVETAEVTEKKEAPAKEAKKPKKPKKLKKGKRRPKTKADCVQLEIANIEISQRLKDAVPVDLKAREALNAALDSAGCVRDPVDVVPRGKKYLLLEGHGRLDWTVKAGKLTIPALVRWDLADKAEDELVIESVTINALSRRHLSEPDWVRIGLNLEQAQSALPEEKRPKGKLAEFIAARINMSPTTFKRAKKVLLEGDAGRAPVADLYKRLLVRADLAHKVIQAGLSSEAQVVAVEDVLTQKSMEPNERAAYASEVFNRLLAEHGSKKAPTDARPVEHEPARETVEKNAPTFVPVVEIVGDRSTPEPPPTPNAEIKNTTVSSLEPERSPDFVVQVIDHLSRAADSWANLTQREWKLTDEQRGTVKSLLSRVEGLVADLEERATR